MITIAKVHGQSFPVILIVWMILSIWAFRSLPDQRLEKIEHWVVEAVAQDGSTIIAREFGPSPAGPSPTTRPETKPITITVPQPLRATAQTFKVGDRTKIALTSVPAAATLESIDNLTADKFPDDKLTKKRPTTFGRRLLLIVGIMTVPILAGLALSGAFLGFIIGKDNRYSNSKTQAAIWFSVLIGAYLTTFVLRRVIGGPDYLDGIQIPTNLLLLSGLSALTFAGAKWLTTAKIDQAAKKAEQQDKAEKKELAEQAKNSPQVALTQTPQPSVTVTTAGIRELAEKDVKPKADQPHFARDLVTDDDGNPDFADFQMLVVTVLAVVVYLIQFDQFLGALPFSASVSLPDVDSTILAAFGLGQGAYLIKKAASDSA
jgi:hypothetical protein